MRWIMAVPKEAIRRLPYRRSNLSFQQNLPRFNLAVMILRAQSNRLMDLRPLVPKLFELLPMAKRGEVLWVSS